MMFNLKGEENRPYPGVLHSLMAAKAKCDQSLITSEIKQSTHDFNSI